MSTFSNQTPPGAEKDRHASLAVTITLLALTLATGVEQWTGSGLSVVLPDLAGSLGSSADEASWSVTLYSTAFAVSVALTHRLANMFGNRRLLSLACLVYAVSSLGCAASYTLPTFLLSRVVQGFAGGVFLARTLVFVTHQFPRPQRPACLRLYATGFFLMGRLAAPIAAGWMNDFLSWRLLFLANIPMMLLAAWLFHRYAAKHWRDDVEEHTADWLGLSLLLFGAAAVQTGLSRGEIDDWFGSPKITFLIVFGIAANLLFAAWQLAPANKRPLLHLGRLYDRGLFSAVVLGIVLGMLFGGSLYVLPQYLRRVESHSALQTGEFMAISGVASIVVLLLVPQLAKMIAKLTGKVVLAFALFVQMIAMGWLGYIITGDTPDRNLIGPLLLNGLFVGIAAPTLALAAFIKMEDGHASNARAIYYGSRQFGASLGVTAVVALIDRRASLHSSRLLDHLFTRNLSVIGLTMDPSNVHKIAGAVTKQSMVLTYADVFYSMAALAAVMLLLLPLLPTASPATPAKVAASQADSMSELKGAAARP